MLNNKKHNSAINNLKYEKFLLFEDLIDLSNRFVIHCESESEANELAEYMNKNGLTFCDFEPYVGNTNWNKYKEETCYLISAGKFGDRTCFLKDKQMEFKIISYKDVRYIFSESGTINII